MEQFDQLEGFDKENTSRYSSVDPIQNISQASSSVYDFIGTHNPMPNINKIASDAFDNLSSAAKAAYNDAKNININDFYASRPVDSTMRNIMQNPSVNRASDNFSKYLDNSYNFYNPNVVPLQPNVVPMQPIVNHHQNNSIINYNTVLLIIVLILIFVAWKYWAKK